MAIGLGIVLLVLGLILLLGAVDMPTSFDNAIASETLGWILVIAGGLAIALSIVLNAQRQKTTHVEERREM